jgi:hypothetical protein
MCAIVFTIELHMLTRLMCHPSPLLSGRKSSGFQRENLFIADRILLPKHLLIVSTFMWVFLKSRDYSNCIYLPVLSSLNS